MWLHSFELGLPGQAAIQAPPPNELT